MAGLSVSDIVNVTVDLAPLALPQRNFGILLIVGGTDKVISTAQRYRQYADIDEVAGDFGNTDPEYLAAVLFFEQAPQPSILYIGRWAETASAGQLRLGTLTAAEQAMGNFTAITSGGFSITFDGGSPTVVSGIDLSGATNLNGVAALIEAELPLGAECVWNVTQSRFEIYSATTGGSSSVTVMSATALSAVMNGTAVLGALAIPGIAAETPLAAVQAIATHTTEWYGLMFAIAAEGDIDNDDYTDVANYIEAANPRHILGITTADTASIDANDATDIGSVLKALSLNHSFVQYSTTNINAVASFYGRALTVDFAAQNSMITMMFKNEPGVSSELLTSTQAATLKDKNVNVFVFYENFRAIVQYGTMASGYYFDVIQGVDWLANAVQTELFNLLVAAPKIPQTDQGVNLLLNGAMKACSAGVNNGLIAPGQWNGPNVGKIKTGAYLPAGFYGYAAPIATQSQADREARKSPPLQILVKLAGAIHTVDAIISVNQ